MFDIVQDRFDASGAWLNPDDSNWWEKVDVAGATVPQVSLR